MSLSPTFRVTLSDFKASGINARANPPYCVRGSFDGKPFHTEYFHSQSMSPMWTFKHGFEYCCPTLEGLVHKSLLLECYGDEQFIGVARIDLHSIATGPTDLELPVREGSRTVGTVSCRVGMEQIASVTVQLTHVSVASLSMRGSENPSPYLAFGLRGTGAILESAVAPSATSPQYDRLPALHLKTTFQELRSSQITAELKHARNGFSPGITDPTMGNFDIFLGTLGFEVGRDCSLPIREMVHSASGYPYPFSAQVTANLEIRNIPKLVQMVSGVLTEDGVIGGRPASPRAPSPPRARVASPPKLSTAAPRSPVSFAPVAPIAPAQIRSADVEVLESVADQQSGLLVRLSQRIEAVARRRTEIQEQLSVVRTKDSDMKESNSRRRNTFEADLRAASAERERIELSLKEISVRREEELRLAQQQAEAREAERRSIEDQQREVDVLQARFTQLRAEMTRHLEEEEARYLQRLREAEESRRRAQQDMDELAQLESRLEQAEGRAATRQRDEEQRARSRSGIHSPSRR